MLCPNCETENRDGAKFCDECGFPLTGAIAARAAEVAAARSDEGRSAEGAEGAAGATAAIEAIPGGEPGSVDGETAEPEGAPCDGPREAPEAEFGEEAVQEPEAQADEGAPDAGEGAGDADATMAIDADLAGLEHVGDEYGERIVDSGYQQPQANWRDGNTMQMPRVEGEEAPRSRDFLASSATKQGNGKKVAIGIAVAAVAVAAIVAFATYQMQIWGGKVVPDVRGMTEADASSVLEDSGFDVRSTQVKSDDTEGLVLLMDPTAGSRANEGDEIVIHIATAREVPDVVGKAEDEAKEELEDAGYENVTYDKEHSDAEEGTVLSVSPEAGTRAKSSVAVIVKVAQPYTVPDTSTLSLDESIDAIQREGLRYDVSYVDTQDYVEGTVLGTEPAAGTKVKSDAVVVIEVARARGAQLAQLTADLLAPGSELSLGGTNYIVSSVGTTSYLGNDQVAFTASARPYTYFFGVYVEGDMQQVSGVVTWTADNQVASIS